MFLILVNLYPEEYKFKTIKEGLEIIAKSETVMNADYFQLKHYIKSNPFHVQRIDVFATVGKFSSSLIFPHNSPLKPIFTKAVTGIQEKGLQEKICQI